MSGQCWKKTQLVPNLVAEATSLLKDWIPDPWVSCDLDDHAFGEHHAMLDDLDRHDALWVRWAGEEMTLVRLRYCESSAVGPNPEACWLFAEHRGGHTWERYR